MENRRKGFIPFYGHLAVLILTAAAIFLYMDNSRSDPWMGRVLDQINLGGLKLVGFESEVFSLLEAFSNQQKQGLKDKKDDSLLQMVEIMMELFRSRMQKIKTHMVQNQQAKMNEKQQAQQWKEILRNLRDQQKEIKGGTKISKDQLLLGFLSKQRFVHAIVEQIECWVQEINKQNTMKLLNLLRELLSDLRSTIAKIKKASQSQADKMLAKYLTIMLRLVVKKFKHLEIIMNLHLRKHIEIKDPMLDNMSQSEAKRELLMMRSTEGAAHQLLGEHYKKMGQHLMCLEQKARRIRRDWYRFGRDSLDRQIEGLSTRIDQLQTILYSMKKNVNQCQERLGVFDLESKHLCQSMKRFEIVKSMLVAFDKKYDREGDEGYNKKRRKLNIKPLPKTKKFKVKPVWKELGDKSKAEQIRKAKAAQIMLRVHVVYDESFVLVAESNADYNKVQKYGWKPRDDNTLGILFYQLDKLNQLWKQQEKYIIQNAQRREVEELLGLCREMITDEMDCWTELKKQLTVDKAIQS